MGQRKGVPPDVELQVLLKSRRRCCLCVYLDNNDVVQQGQIAHIDRDSSNSDLGNLAFLCLQHHDQYDTRPSQSKRFSPEELRAYRDRLHQSTNESGMRSEVRDISGRFRLCFGTIPTCSEPPNDISVELHEKLGHLGYDPEGADQDADPEFDVDNAIAALVALDSVIIAWHIDADNSSGEVQLAIRNLTATERAQMWRILEIAFDEFDVEGNIILRVAFDDLGRGALIEQYVAIGVLTSMSEGIPGLLQKDARFDLY